MTVFEEKKVLIIAPEHKLIFKDYKQFGYNVLPTFRSEKLLSRIIRELFIRLHLPFQKIFFTPIPTNYDYYIIYDSLLCEKYIQYVSKRIPNNRVFFFFDNIVGKRRRIVEQIEKRGMVMTTLEEKDAKDYKMLVLDDFFNKEYRCYSKECLYDIVFFGKDKGRLKQLADYKRLFDEKNIKSYFHITKTTRFSKNNPIYKKAIPYKSILKKVAQSKAVLEVLQKGQNGLTLRAMESLFLEKKLITTSKSIKNYKFYRKNNVFIIGEDDVGQLRSFLDSPYEKIPEDIVSYYEYANVWSRMISSLETDEKQIQKTTD